MMILFVLLGFSLLVMLSFTAIFYRLSPYNGMGMNLQLPRWEKALLYFVMAYPMASLLVMLIQGGLTGVLPETKPLFRSTYFLFSAAHVFLSAMSGVVSYRLRGQGLLFKLFFALNLLAGCVYVLGLLAVFLD